MPIRNRSVRNTLSTIIRANLEMQVSERTTELRLANMELTSARDEAQRIADRNEHLARHKQAILNTAAEGIFGIDESGVATFINRAAANMLGSTVAELLGRALHPIIHETEFLTKSRVPLTTLALRVLALLNAHGAEEESSAA